MQITLEQSDIHNFWTVPKLVPVQFSIFISCTKLLNKLKAIKILQMTSSQLSSVWLCHQWKKRLVSVLKRERQAVFWTIKKTYQNDDKEANGDWQKVTIAI